MADIEKLFYITSLICWHNWGPREESLRKNVIYALTLFVLMVLGFGLIHEASSQTENQSDSLRVLNYSWYFDSIGGFHVVGEVQNQGPLVLNPVVLGGTIYTPDGTAQIRSNPCRVYVNYMLPDQKAPFLMDFGVRDMSWMSQGIDHVDFTTIQADSNSSYQYPDLSITSSTLSTDSTGVYWVSGKVQNTGNRTATNVRVIGTFFNATNDVVAAGYSVVLTPNLLNPSSSASFKVGAFDVNKTETSLDRQISSYTLMVQIEGPLLSGTLPASTSYSSSNSSSTESPSSDGSSSDDSPSNLAGPDYFRYIAIVAIVIAAISGLLVYSRKKTSKVSAKEAQKSQSTAKRRQPRRRGHSNV